MNKMRVERKVVNMCKNELNKQPEYLQISPWLIMGRSWRKEDYQESGILRIPDTDGRKCQEFHNASHAAWIFYMVILDILRGKPDRNTSRRANRIIAHLSCLREFLDEEKDFRFLMILNRLIKILKRSFPKDQFKWTRFIVEHWPLIRAFSTHYGFEKKSLIDGQYERVCQYFDEMLVIQRGKGEDGEEKSSNTGC